AAGVDVELEGRRRVPGGRVVDLHLAAHELGEEHPAVVGDVHAERRGGVLVRRDALVHAPVGATAVAFDEAGGPLDTTDDVLDQVRLLVVAALVAHAGHPGPAAVIQLAPRDRVVVTHGVAARVVRRLVQRGEHVRLTADVRRVVVPLVLALPARGQVRGRRVDPVLDADRAGQAAGGVPGHGRADQVVPPLVVAAHVGGVVDGDDAAAGLLVALHGGLLVGRPRVAGGLEHHQRVELREVLVVEDGRVLGVVGGDADVRESVFEHGR